MKPNPLAHWWRKREREPRPDQPEPTSTACEPFLAEVIRPEDFVGHDADHNQQVVREGFLDKAHRYLRHLPMAEEVVAAYFCMLDGRTPLWVKGTVAAALAYFILPLDAIPDMLPIVGLNDDAAVLAAALSAIAAHLSDEHRARARALLRSERISTAPHAGQP